MTQEEKLAAAEKEAAAQAEQVYEEQQAAIKAGKPVNTIMVQIKSDDGPPVDSKEQGSDAGTDETPTDKKQLK